MGHFKAAHLTVIKRFEFSEPVFQPEKLASSMFSWLPFAPWESYTFLGDTGQLKVLIDHMKTIPIRGVGYIKPIRNPYVSQELFWVPFKPRERTFKSGIRPDLPMYPFQVIPSTIQITLDRGQLEAVLGFAVSDHKAFWEVRIYPVGVSIAHLHLWVEARETSLDLNGLARLRSQLRSLPVTVVSEGKRVSYNGVFKAFSFLVNRVTSGILSGGHKRREFPGYYVVCNLQGGPVKLSEYADALAKILAGHHGIPSDLYSSELEGKHKDDILAVGRHAAIIYVDAGIWEKYQNRQRPGVLEGRRCFRHHFVSAIELAYVTEALISIYNSHFNDILEEIEKIPLGMTWDSIIKKYTTRGVLDPCAYGTLQHVILDIPARLRESRKDEFWADVYGSAAYELELSNSLEELKTTTDKVYQAAVKYRSDYTDRISTLAVNISATADRVIEFIKVAKPLLRLSINGI